MIKLSCLLLLFLSSCGYHFHRDDIFGDGTLRKVSVPYIAGDVDGDFTSALIQEMVYAGFFTYEPCSADLQLIVSIIDYDDENIGFRYDRNRKGHLTKAIIPTETRSFLTVEVRLEDQTSGKDLLPPVRLRSSIDFDHDYEASRGRANIFSLGQLTDFDAAREAVNRPLHRAMAKKIVDYLQGVW